jgi:hypothetical protein
MMKDSKPHFAAQNFHGHAKEFFWKLSTIPACAVDKVTSPGLVKRNKLSTMKASPEDLRMVTNKRYKSDSGWVNIWTIWQTYMHGIRDLFYMNTKPLKFKKKNW